MMYFGTVLNVTDPEKLGRVRISVYGIHDNILEKDLSWSQVMMPANTPAISGIGSSVNLLVGSLVAGIFLDSTQQEFMAMGSLPTKTASTFDNNVRVRGEANPHAGEPAGGYQPTSTYAPEYPYNNVTEYESGHVKEYDDTPGRERIVERHMSGTQYEIAPNGSKNETIVRDNYRLVVGQDTLEVYGDVQIIVSGHADIAVGGNLTTSVTGNIAADAFGDITLKTNDTTKKITLDGNVDITENLTVAKDVEVTGNTLTKGTTTTSETQVIDLHTHNENNVLNGPTTQLT